VKRNRKVKSQPMNERGRIQMWSLIKKNGDVGQNSNLCFPYRGSRDHDKRVENRMTIRRGDHNYE